MTVQTRESSGLEHLSIQTLVGPQGWLFTLLGQHGRTLLSDCSLGSGKRALRLGFQTGNTFFLL